jgi:hypothetical protein
VLRRIRDRLEGRFRIAVAEVDHQDLWQRSALGVALVARSEESARNALQAVRREVETDPRLAVAEFAVLVERFDSGEADRWGDWGGPSSGEALEEDEPGGEP